MKRGGAHTVRGQKAPTSRPTAEQVFVYGTIPRNFRGGSGYFGGGRGYNNHNQNFTVSSNQNQLPYTPTGPNRNQLPYSPTGPHSGRLGPGQVTHGSSNNVSTFRSEFVPTPMVVDGGLVLNRFSRPGGGGGGENPYGYGRTGNGGVVEAKNSPMNLEFYRNPHQHQELSPVSQEGGDYWSPTGSFDMSYNSSTPPALPEHPPTPRRPPPENKPSLLLNKEENQTIFDILGKGRQTLATAVIRLLVPTFSQQGWQPKETGVACLVRDTTKKSYFIQVFSLRSKSMVFRQEIYNQFEYQLHSHYQNFITFEGDSSSVGIQFADITEATQFRDALDSKLEAKKQRRNEREHRRSRILTDSNHHYPNQNQNAGHQYPQQTYTQPPPTPPVPQYTHQPPVSHNNSSSSSMSNGISSQQTVSTTTTYNFPTSLKLKKTKEKDKDKKKIVLRKEDIGKPMDFRHIQHVGWDPNKGFDLNGVDNNLRTFFEKAGVSANQLQDENTRNFIYNFIEQNGGIETIKKLPERPAAPLPPSSHSMGHAPPVPNRQASKPAAPPPPPSRPIPPVPGSYNSSGGGPPPPPPPTRTMNIGERPQMNYQSPGYNQNNGPARPPPPAISSQSSPKPAHSNGPVPPPPPPPPPMPGVGAPPPPPPPPASSGPSEITDNGRTNAQQPKRAPPVVDDRSQLLAAIQKGVQLKKVDPEDAQAKPKSSGGGLADCLGQIQKGIELKPVPQTTKEAPNADTMDGLAGALARALADRSKAIRPDSSSSEDEEEEGADDDEWD